MANTKTKTEKTYRINGGTLTTQLAKNDTCNWVIEAGVKQFKEGKTPGKLMIAFLQQMNILRIEEN